MKKKVLITGGTGLLGTYLLQTVPKDIELYATLHEFKDHLNIEACTFVDLDIRNKKQVEKVISDIAPDFVFHTAAHARLDYCEENKDDARSTNYLGTTYIVDCLKKTNGRIVFCSTNATYDGFSPPYDEKSPQKGRSFYAKTKINAEKYIEKHSPNFTIVRLMTMYGWNLQPNKKNMVSMAIEKLSQNDPLWMTNDVFNNMLYAREAARFFWSIVRSPKVTKNTKFNIAGKNKLNRYDTTMQICEVFGLNKTLVTEVSSDYFSGKEVTRAPDTSFSTARAEKIMKFRPITLRTGLKHMLTNTLPHKSSLASNNSIFDEKYFTEYYQPMTGEFSEKDLERNYNWFFGWFNALQSLYDFREGHNKKVLEIGCAIGAASRILAERSFSVIATDISHHAVTKAAQVNVHKNLTFEELDIEKQSTYSNEFDVIFGFEVIEHLEKHEQALAQVHSMLKPGGVCIFSTPYPYTYVFRDKTHVNVRHPLDWVRIFKKMNFKNVVYKQISFVPLFYKYSKYFHLTFPGGLPTPYINSTIFIYAEK